MSALQHGLTPKMKPISPRRSAVICALDIGTSKIACLIARLKPCGAQEALRRRSHVEHDLLTLVEAFGSKATSLADSNITTHKQYYPPLIARLREQGGYTILVIEHDMHVVEGISDRVVALDHGTKIAEGTFEQVATNERVVEAYLGLKATATK